jgi:hypothetical protein
MKTVFTLLLATIITTAAFAADEGRLSITVAVQKDAVVYVDGRTYQPDDNSIVIDNIRSGNHSIKVYRKMNNRNNNGRNNNRNNQREELLYSSTVYVRPAYHVDIVVNRFGKALVDEKAINTRDDDWGRDDNWGRDRDRDNNNSYNRAMSDYDFNALHQKIKGAWFGSSKMTLAKDAFSRNYFSTSQVKQILQLFNPESDKLELAKLAYRNTVDQRSFFQLYDVFSFQSSKDELDRYIRDFRY